MMQDSMTLRRLKWLAVLAPLLFLGAVEVARRILAPDLFQDWPGYLLLAGIVLLGTLFFAETIFGIVGWLQSQLTQQNRELLALHNAGLDILRELDLESVLQQVVDRARDLVGARYGALSLLREGGGIEAFLTSGITAEERARIGPVPAGHGLLEVVLDEGRPLRLDDLTQDARSVGFPPFHPPMHSLLALPVVSQGRVLGNLYVTEKEARASFNADDEETLARFATLAALAIENARLHRQVQAYAVTEERERIAREMHDSLAQVLGYVNTKAQAAQVLLENGKSEQAATHISQLSEAARAAYADVREGILGLRTSLGEGRGFVETLGEYVDLWQQQSGVGAELVLSPQGFTPDLAPFAEVQLVRIIQEALANVRKHASARRATVTLSQADAGVEVAINDDGIGFDPNALRRTDLPRFGLTTMRERAEAVGGTFAVSAVPGGGTRVVVHIPNERVSTNRGGVPIARAHR
jgi:nitrate/nitrite-specific signal transduction histidine kinase